MVIAGRAPDEIGKFTKDSELWSKHGGSHYFLSRGN